ncbi:MAG: hypothetical protein KTR16_12070 [Acidiferrobacterales bacterium]|nr:hypothetical protein [Acidiferrobacterales bacterium]
MIRLILIAIGIFIIWVLFLSKFNKKKKIAVCVAALAICIAGLWFDQSSRTPKENIISKSELVDCGVSAKHSYRTNFDIEFCLRNLSTSATARRVAMSFVALDCIDGSCEELQVMTKEVPLSLAPETEITLEENISFDKVDASSETVVWVAKVMSVKALD